MKNKKSFPKVVIICCTLAVLSFVLFFFALRQYEKSLSSVVAASQDGYVQLVVDQINLKDNRDDEEIISSILSSLDASNSKYWAFTKGDTILYIKDVQETNRYKLFTSSSFYDSKEAQDYYQNLKRNSVTHKLIRLKDKDYIASGTVFNYNGSDYRLVLLSNKDMVFENNVYLRGKIELCLLFYGASLIFLVMAAVLSWKLDQSRSFGSDEGEMIRELNERVYKLNEIIQTKETVKHRHFDLEVLDEFMQSYLDRDIPNGILVDLTFTSVGKMRAFFEELPEDIICFMTGRESMLLLSVYQDEEELKMMCELDCIAKMQMRSVVFSEVLNNGTAII
ncbi:MAG: hypothetical protein Q4B60_01160 [Erysipelotrichaceae bacterium]|nr:hypothetical protein [Erysipelotrichaceae bacterium]